VLEDERAADGRVVGTATVFLTGRACPWHCAMCDLWRGTIAQDTPRGALPRQLELVGERIAGAAHVKLYNAGSFFDSRAVPVDDYGAIAERVAGFENVVVESHPALVGERLDRLRDSMAWASPGAPPLLEVAMGLETAHPEALRRLDKGVTVGQFATAAEALRTRGVALRVFLLVGPPFVAPEEQDAWLLRSVETAFECGASVVSLIPTRGGNPPLDAMIEAGAFHTPRLADLERGFEAALAAARGRGRVFADLWNLARFAGCERCLPARRERLHRANLEQRLGDPVACDA